MTAETGLARYYDRLSSWNGVARFIGRGGGREHFTVHRALADPRADGRPTATRLHDVLREFLPTDRPIALLDAGCGDGGTMMDLARTHDGRFLGITLSARQVARATAVLRERGLAARIGVIRASYDQPPTGPFDVIIAIESLAHSADPHVSLRALSAVLAPGGHLVVIDDMPEIDLRDGDLAAFKRGWRCPVLWSAAAYRTELVACGLALVAERDLSAELRPRDATDLARLTRLNRWARAVVPIPAFRMVMDSHHGGLALERLYRRGAMSYRMMMATRS